MAWEVRMSSTRQQAYFYDAETKESRWSPPDGMSDSDIAALPGADYLRTDKKPANATSMPSSVRASHILVKHRDSRRPSSWKESNITRSKAEAISTLQQHETALNALPSDQRVKTFGAIASKESDCSSHSNAGDLGAFRPGQMQKPFEDAAFALEVGDMSSVVETESGVHLILRYSEDHCCPFTACAMPLTDDVSSAVAMSLIRYGKACSICGFRPLARSYVTEKSRGSTMPAQEAESASSMRGTMEETPLAMDRSAPDDNGSQSRFIGARTAEGVFAGRTAPLLQPAVPTPLQGPQGKPVYSTWHPPAKRTDEPPAWRRRRRGLEIPDSVRQTLVARLRLHAYTIDKARLGFFTTFAQRAADEMGIPTGKHLLPTQVASVAMTAGPFVDAKAKSYYWRRTHRREVRAYNASPSVIQSWVAYLKRTVMPGIGLQIETISYHPVGFGSQMGKSGTQTAAHAPDEPSL